MGGAPWGDLPSAESSSSSPDCRLLSWPYKDERHTLKQHSSPSELRWLLGCPTVQPMICRPSKECGLRSVAFPNTWLITPYHHPRKLLCRCCVISPTRSDVSHLAMATTQGLRLTLTLTPNLYNPEP